jgi:hypothetical protein
VTGRLLHSHTQCLSDRDLFVHALLGLLSVSERLERAMTEVAHSVVGKTRRAQAPNAVYAVLGCISLAKGLRAELATWRAIDDASRGPSKLSETTRGLLR